ncbi:hypothetical protein LCGC14_1965250 [marine sediment metagenome]|uniref:Uncharacterized protein n=1 Tax=marine sediment metagenome TaxID=412755 RepID=A0A0F9G1R8_9ZZZZ
MKRIVYTLTVVIGSPVNDPQEVADSLDSVYDNVDASQIDNIEIMEDDSFQDYLDTIRTKI